MITRRNLGAVTAFTVRLDAFSIVEVDLPDVDMMDDPGECEIDVESDGSCSLGGGGDCTDGSRQSCIQQE